MNDAIAQVLGYLRGIWRFRWLIFIVAWPVAIAGWIFVSQMPDQYKASARVYVDTRSVLTPLLRGLAIQSDIGSEIQLITKTIFSRPNLEKIARMTDMDLKAETDQDMNQITNRLKSRLGLASGRGDNLFQISYTNEDPKLAKNVVQSLLTVFIESTLGDKRKDSDSAQRFLSEQIKDYEQKLIEAENRLTKFKQQNMAMLGSIGGSSFGRLEAGVQELRNVQLLKREAQQRRDELQRQLEDLEDEGEEDSLLDYGSGSVASTDPRIQQLELKRDGLLLRFTKKHPDVVAINKTIEHIQKQKLANANADVPKPKDPALVASPVYQQLKLTLGEAEANLASLNVREKEFKSRVKKLEEMVNTIPAVETELKRLDRDYSVNKKNYNLLVSRRESAKLGEQAGESAETVKFRVIDPPFVGDAPVSPNRPVLMSVVLVGSLIAGLAFPLFLSLIKPAVDSVKLLQDLTKLPVLGAVSIVRTPAQVKRRRFELLSFLFMGLMLVIAYGVVMTLTLMDNGLSQIVGRFL